MLNVEDGIVIGRIDVDGDFNVVTQAEEDGGGGTADEVAIAISIDQLGFLSVAQFVAIKHDPNNGPDDQEVMSDGALLAKLTATDGDGDTHVVTEPIGDAVKIDDDGPTVTVTTDVDSGEIAALLRNLDETIDADGDHTADTADTYSAADTTLDNNGDLDDVIVLGVSNEPVFQLSPSSADAIGRLSTTAGQLQALFGDAPADFEAFVDFGTDGPGDTIDTDGRTDALSFVDFGDPIETNLTATEVDGSALDGASAAERKIHLVWVSATVIEGGDHRLRHGRG